MNSRNYRDLIVWQKGMKLAHEVYTITELFPRSELFGLTSQMRDCTVSIPSNIAEGSKRTTKKDFRRFLCIAYGSGAELETQIEIAKGLKWAEGIDFSKIDGLLQEVMRMLNKLIQTISSSH